MNNLETKKLSRSEMKSVLGGVGRVCVTSADCPPGQSCVSGEYRYTCQKDEVPPTTFAKKVK